MPSLRQRNRLNAMRLTQRTALAMFEAEGFEAVTVNQIAAEVGMAASTIYRHFDTKEAIVLWDEHDADMDAAYVREFTAKPPFAALRAVYADELGPRYDDDLEFQLRRVQFIYRTEGLHAAAVEADYRDTQELTAALETVLSKKHRGSAVVLARAALAALDIAFDRWQAAGGIKPLGPFIHEAFDAFANLDALR
ncbi:MAG: helix-turn-helix domain-containing protein [Actinomycetota bacterium]